jgi:hypothetical protein
MLQLLFHWEIKTFQTVLLLFIQIQWLEMPIPPLNQIPLTKKW